VAVLLSLLLGGLSGSVGVVLLNRDAARSGGAAPSATATAPLAPSAAPSVPASPSGLAGRVVTLAAVHSGKCLDVPNGQAQPGLRLQQADCLPGGPNQRFRLDPVPGGSAVYLIHAEVTSYCLAAVGGAPTDGSPLVQVPGCTGASEQQFLVRTVAGDPATGAAGVAAPLDQAALAALSGPRTVEVISATSGRCVDVEGVSTDAGAGVWLWTCVGQPNQRWQLTPG
jgi:hypothetical protein